MHLRFLAIIFILLFSCNSDTSSNKHTKDKQVYTQHEIIQTMVPILKSQGMGFKKFKKILAREAQEGEQIQTITGDGLETSNTANAGDFIVKNQTDAGEMYIVPAKKFHDRYDFSEEGQGGFSVYASKGKIIGVEMNESLLKQLELANEFYLVAPWGEEMIVKKDDYLVCPLDFSEVYRIARKEFFETYKPDE